MKKILFHILFLTYALINYAQGKDYFVAFCANKASYNTLGHAFIMIGKGEPFTSSEGGECEVFGLYAIDVSGECKPANYNALKSFFFGELPGCLFNDISASVDNYLVVRCQLSDYIKARLEIENWKQKKYELKRQDCLTFVISVAKIFSPQLTIPPRTAFKNFPHQYILELKKKNLQIKN